MWLLDTENIQLKWFGTPSEVSYAILSHVWGHNEQPFQDVPKCPASNARPATKTLRRARDRALRRPSLKIKSACARARHDGFRWLWVDTCCIDKANSAELSEAINSMYAWYEGSAMCYAYLHDVPSGEDPNAPHSAFRTSVWFSRGWTLQELIAPHSVIFLAQDWSPIGPKRLLATLIERITGVDHLVLTHRRRLDDVSVACRMSWAAKRKTTRIEDEAYALMGIFGVYMSTIYGEGRHAFVRLQEEILKKCPDQTIFAWGPVLEDHRGGTFVECAREHDYAPQARAQSLLAPSPAEFAGCADLRPVPQRDFATRLGLRESMPEYNPTGYGVRTTLPIVSIAHTSTVDAALALLACQDDRGRLVALYLRSHPGVGSQYFVGGYIARGGRRNHYYRGAHVPLPNLPKSGTTPARAPVRVCGGVPAMREVHVHAEPESRAARRRSVASERPVSTIESSRTSSMVFFEPPCTVVLSRRSVRRLQRLGFAAPAALVEGIRLENPGDVRCVRFVGYNPFTVHLGVCPAKGGGSLQAAQLWATVRFERDIESALPERTSLAAAVAARKARVVPDESMYVQTWKSARAKFGTRDANVVLTFSYPDSAAGEQTDVYELDIRYDGVYLEGEMPLRRRSRRTSTMTTATAISSLL